MEGIMLSVFIQYRAESPIEHVVLKDGYSGFLSLLDKSKDVKAFKVMEGYALVSGCSPLGAYKKQVLEFTYKD